MIAKARWEAKKQKIRHGIPLPQEPFPLLIEHPKFYELLGNTSELTVNRGLSISCTARSSGTSQEHAAVGLLLFQQGFRPWLSQQGGAGAGCSVGAGLEFAGCLQGQAMASKHGLRSGPVWTGH